MLNNLTNEQLQFRRKLIGRSLSECTQKELVRLTETMRPSQTYTDVQKAIHKSVYLYVSSTQKFKLYSAIRKYKNNGGLSVPKIWQDVNREVYLSSKLLTDSKNPNDTYHYLWNLLITYTLVSADTIEWPIELEETESIEIPSSSTRTARRNPGLL